MAIIKKKISELEESSSLSGLYTVGTKETVREDEFGQPVIRQESVKIGLEFIKESTEEATDAADNANSAAQTAAQAAENATDAAAAASAAAEAANNATAAATEATENANTQAEYAKAQGDYALEQAIANKSGILLDTTLSPDEVNAKMTEILQAFLINPAVLITIKADIETEGQPEYKWFNYAVTDYSDNGETQTLTLLSETTTDNNRLSVKIVGTGTGNSITNTRITISQTPFVTDNWENIPEEIPDNDDNFLFNNGTENKKITKNNLIGLVPYIGENRCDVSYFSLYANNVGNTVIPDGFAKYNPLFEIGKTYVISGYTNGEPTGQIQIQTTSGYTNYNFNTPFTITEEVINLYFRGTPDILNTFSKIKIEEGTRATPFIPGNIVPVLDYTNLEEQIVPGEFWLDEDGIKRQVYCQSFVGTLNTESDSTALLNGVHNVQIVQGYINYQNKYNMPFFSIHGNGNVIQTTYLTSVYVSNTYHTIWINADTGLRGAKYAITVKYTKA